MKGKIKVRVEMMFTRMVEVEAENDDEALEIVEAMNLCLNENDQHEEAEFYIEE